MKIFVKKGYVKVNVSLLDDPHLFQSALFCDFCFASDKTTKGKIYIYTVYKQKNH